MSLLRNMWYRVISGDNTPVAVEQPVRITQSLEESTTYVSEITLADQAMPLDTNTRVRIYRVNRGYPDPYSGLAMRKIFEGRSNRIASVSYPHQVTVTSTGPLSRLRRTRTDDFDLSGRTDTQIAKLILDYCDVDYTTAWIHGRDSIVCPIVPAYWKKGQSGADILAELDRVFACATMENGDGEIFRIRYSLVPADYPESAIKKTFVRGQKDATFYEHERDVGDIDAIQNYWRVSGVTWESEEAEEFGTRTIGVINGGWQQISARNWRNAAGAVVMSTYYFEDGTWGNPTLMGYPNGGLIDTAIGSGGGPIGGVADPDPPPAASCSYAIFAEAIDVHPKLGAGVFVGPQEFSSEFIQHEMLAKAIAKRLMRWYNREPDRIRIVTATDPALYPGVCVVVKDNIYGVDRNMHRYVVVATQIDGDIMQLDCVGGNPGEVGTLTSGVEVCCGTQQEDGTCIDDGHNSDDFDDLDEVDLPDFEPIPDHCDPLADPTCIPGEDYILPPDLNTLDPFLDCEEVDLGAVGEAGPPAPPGFDVPGHYVLAPDMDASNYRPDSLFTNRVAYHILPDGSCDHVALDSFGQLFPNTTTPYADKEWENDANMFAGPGGCSISGEAWLKEPPTWLTFFLTAHSDAVVVERLDGAIVDFYTSPGMTHTFTGAIGTEDDLVFRFGISTRTEHSIPDYSPYGPPHNCDYLFRNCNNGGWDAEGGLPTGEWMPFTITWDFTEEYQRTYYSVAGYGGYIEDLREINLSPGDNCCGGGPQHYDTCDHPFHRLRIANEGVTSGGDDPADWHVRLRNLVVAHATCTPNPDYVDLESPDDWQDDMPERRITPDDIAEDVRRLVRSTREAQQRGRYTGLTTIVGGGGSTPPSTPGMTNPMDSQGQLIRGGTAGSPQKLTHPGIAGRVLTSTISDVSWQVPSGGSSSVTTRDLLTNGDPLDPQLIFADGDVIWIES